MSLLINVTPSTLLDVSHARSVAKDTAVWPGDEVRAYTLAELVLADCQREHGNNSANCLPRCDAARQVLR